MPGDNNFANGRTLPGLLNQSLLALFAVTTVIVLPRLLYSCSFALNLADERFYLPGFASRIKYVRVSEPDLAPNPTLAQQTAEARSAMANARYGGWYSIEMKPPADLGLKTLESSTSRLAAKLAESKDNLI
ncbi:hypothetical protein [Bradyrhizobium archetypum]|uniref:Uncharacterized protein n=1 Tax=Bradyrhizobium archetypum TaxID=2721160 RepID=A0A7Y4HB27_9BRAD|nr:hypothetical protein [Bradyrhizobium archetypum]NOJ50950.1 hypothetical protein [Bradyrhizobium archetypum]